ncbi:hypothetical protein PR202_gb15827 [Eleusine coracana subsp. coracana]|uniref:Uncharacterized protein n=1 Tax=Eleusine coracana subsp. coracana TaxID=191504 RepID=A0AAV5EYU5_ELECO|nr:hypothetical protein PR202_gb15827 [Eleusine coracana subsp. coracana]
MPPSSQPPQQARRSEPGRPGLLEQWDERAIDVAGCDLLHPIGHAPADEEDAHGRLAGGQQQPAASTRGGAELVKHQEEVEEPKNRHKNHLLPQIRRLLHHSRHLLPQICRKNPRTRET